MPIKSVALVAHDKKKQELISWSKDHKEQLQMLNILATGTTGKLIQQALDREVTLLLSGPLGGDQQIGAKIAEGKIDMLVFFWDPLEPMPHDSDIKALLRIAALWNIPVACNRASADFMIRSPLVTEDYHRLDPDFTSYTQRKL